MKRGLLAWLRRLPYRGSGRLRPHEEAALQAWRETLTPESLRQLDAQLEHFFMVQRLSRDKLVGFFAGRWFGPLPADALFRYRGDGAVARVRMRPAGRDDSSRRQRCDVDVTVYEGRLLALEFTRPPAVMRNGWEVLGVDVMIDPMAERRPAGTPAIPGVPFPEDHEEVLEGRTGSFSSGDWTLFAAGEEWRLVLPHDNFVVLAERTEDSEAGNVRLCVRESDGALVFVDDHGEFLALAGRSFRKALVGGPPRVGETS